MLTILSSTIYRHNRTLVLAIATVIFAVFIFWVLPNEAAESDALLGGLPSPDLSLVYTACDLYDMARGYGAEGRAYYIRSRFGFDLAWPLTYGLFLTSALTILFKGLRVSPTTKLTNLLPLFAVIFDLAENISASVVMYRYPASSNLFARLSPMATLFKWSFVALSIVMVLSGLLLHIRKKRVG